MKRIVLLIFAASLCPHIGAQTVSFDDNWRFAFGDASSPGKDFGRGTEYFNYYTKAASIHDEGPYSLAFNDSLWTPVCLPHDWVVDLPFSSDASKSHGYKTVGWKYPSTSIGWYRKRFQVPSEAAGKSVSVQFDGIFRDSQVWVNGFWIGGNQSGYTSASYDISPYLNYGSDNLITVRADATFEEGWFYEGGGIYRHAWLTFGERADADVSRHMPVIELDPNRGLIIDGRRVQLRGVNIHQDHAGVGTAIPDALYEYRLGELKKLGVNAVRIAHNPASPVLLDICDSLGIYVIEETRLMGVNPVHLEPLRSMIERDRHHPCIIMWGIGNEEWGIEWDPKGEVIAQRMTDFCHGLDPSRPVVVATSSGPEIIKGADIAGYNYILQNPVDKFRTDYPDRVAVGTEETSGCGTRGIYYPEPGRMPSINRRPQGPDSMFNCIERGMKFYEGRPWLCGFFYWTGFDYRGEPDPLVFPATGSQFGILDYCGFPKDEAFYIKSWWTDEPVLHIIPHWNLDSYIGETVSVWVYSNCDEVELYVNGRSAGRKRMQRYGHLEWDAVYTPGSLRAAGYKNGRKILEETVYTASAPASLSVGASKLKVRPDGKDLSVVNVRVVDAKERFVPTARIPVTVSVEGPLRILGAGNGDSAFQGRERPDGSHPETFTIDSFNGCVQFLLQNTGTSGEAAVRLSSEGIETASVNISCF